jgi:hypothetical protein
MSLQFSLANAMPSRVIIAGDEALWSWLGEQLEIVWYKRLFGHGWESN